MKSSRYCFGVLSVGILLLTSCAGEPKAGNQTSETQTAPVASNPASSNASQPAVKPQPFARSTTATGTQLKPVAGLIQPTNAEKRRAAIAKGRRDPFAALVPGPVAIRLQAAKPKSSNVSPVSPMPLPAPAQVTTIPLPTLQPANSNPPNNVPGTAVSIPPRVSLTATAEAIEVIGVIKTGDRVSAIVRSPEEPSGRSVSVGDYLANGQVLIKQIQMKGQGDPIVVLEQNGIDVVKSVGSSVVSTR